ASCNNYLLLERYFTTPMQDADPILVVAIFCVVLINVFSHVARNTCNLVLIFMKAMVETTLERVYPDGIFPRYEQAVLADFPHDIHSARLALNQEPTLIVFASCPACHYCHALQSRQDGQKFP
ncbi:hypothetical protein M422DRAFT_79622, partial [Sphaerobolus stellatus SS14]